MSKIATFLAALVGWGTGEIVAAREYADAPYAHLFVKAAIALTFFLAARLAEGGEDAGTS